MAKNSRNLVLASFLLAVCATTAHAASIAVPADLQLFIPGEGISTLAVSLDQPANALPTELLFAGEIDNLSFFNGAQVWFWFSWTDTDGTAHNSDSEAFLFSPIMGIPYSHAGEFFTRELTLPYSPPEVSVRFSNDTVSSLDGRPVAVTGVFSTVPEPSVFAFLTSVASLGLICVRLPRRK
jgi:hypothetical protein